jgi:hypothetical protein
MRRELRLTTPSARDPDTAVLAISLIAIRHGKSATADFDQDRIAQTVAADSSSSGLGP